jgi:hypothetical protein
MGGKRDRVCKYGHKHKSARSLTSCHRQRSNEMNLVKKVDVNNDDQA